MSNFRNKSTLNKDSAELLLKQNFYESAVSRAYYSVIQMFFDALFYKFKIDQNAFVNETKMNSRGSHQHAFNRLSVELAKQVERSDYRKFQSFFYDLKNLREKADYKEVAITQLESYNALSWMGVLTTMVIKLKQQNETK